MQEITKLDAKLRKTLGTGASRAHRRNGEVPAVIYGKEKEVLHVVILEKNITKLYRKPNYSSSILMIDIEGLGSYKVLPKKTTLHPITDIVNHVDFVYVASSGLQKVDVPILFDGKERSVGVKRGGFFNIIFRKLQVLCNPLEIPREIVVDVSNMHTGSSIKASAIKLPNGCVLVSKKDFVVASITGKGGKASADPSEDDAAK